LGKFKKHLKYISERERERERERVKENKKLDANNVRNFFFLERL